jgi:hypothetical protein
MGVLDVRASLVAFSRFVFNKGVLFGQIMLQHHVLIIGKLELGEVSFIN